MRLMSRTDKNASADIRSIGIQRRARRSRLTDCHCGQQLDVCARAHCPRCGRSIVRD
jgi:hypothetical protein